MAVPAFRATDSGSVQYMRFATSARYPSIERQTNPVISIRASVAERMRVALCDTAVLQPLYTREIVPVSSIKGMPVCSEISSTQPALGLGWKYTRLPSESIFEAVKLAILTDIKDTESGFLKHHLIPMLPDVFIGSRRPFVSYQYPEKGDAIPVNHSEEEIIADLNGIRAFDDIFVSFNQAHYLAISVFAKINGLLAPEKE